ncbi:MAG: hypothetical protein ACTTGJ_01305 [Clostridium sp.]
MKIVNEKNNVEIIQIDVPITKRNVNGKEYLGNYLIGEEEFSNYSNFKTFTLSKAKYIIEDKLKKGITSKELEITITGGAFEFDYYEKLEKMHETLNSVITEVLEKQEEKSDNTDSLKTSVEDECEKINVLEDFLKSVVELAKEYEIKKIALTLPVKYILDTDLKKFKKIGITDIYILAITTLDEYLQKSNVKYTFNDIVQAVKKIRRQKMNVGAELGIGLCEDKQEEMYMVEKMLKLHLKTLIITPIIVFKNTELAKQFVRGNYTPLDVLQLQVLIKEIVQFALKKKELNIQFKTSLQESLIKTKYLNGAVITNIQELIESEICYDYLVEKIKNMNSKVDIVELYVPKNKINLFLGIDNSNIERMFEIYNTKVIVKPSSETGLRRILGKKIYIKIIKYSK